MRAYCFCFRISDRSNKRITCVDELEDRQNTKRIKKHALSERHFNCVGDYLERSDEVSRIDRKRIFQSS